MYIGFKLIGVTNPTMMIIITDLWATSDPNPNCAVDTGPISASSSLIHSLRSIE